MQVKATIELVATDTEIREFVDDRVNKFVVGSLESLIRSIAGADFSSFGDGLKAVVEKAMQAQAAASTGSQPSPSDPGPSNPGGSQP